MKPSPSPADPCAVARLLIDAYLLDEITDDGRRELAEHVRNCPVCTAELGGSTRLIELLTSLPVPQATADLDERILAAAFADRRKRHERVSSLSGLWRQMLRGAMRTTGTLILTVVTVALLGGAFVFAASQFVLPPVREYFSATIQRVATPTPAQTSTPREPTAPPTASPTEKASAPASTVVTAAPTPVPTPVATPKPTTAPTLSPSPAPTPSPTVEPTPEPTSPPTATPEPTPQPTPTPLPTEKPKRTPIPSPTPTPTPTPTSNVASPDVASTTSP